MSETGPGTGKGRGWCERGRQRVRGTKRRMLVEDVQEYWGTYEGEGANTFWNIKYT